MSKLKFTIKKTDDVARQGYLEVNGRALETPQIIHTDHELGKLTAWQLKRVNVNAIKIAGLEWWLKFAPQLASLPDFHDLYHWNGVLLVDQQTDQAYQAAKPRGRKKDGVRFHDPATGQLKFYQPADGLQLQQALGADILQSFERSVDYYAPVDDLTAGVVQTNDWLSEVATVKENVLGAVTGGGLKQLRQDSVTAVKQAGLAGYSLAGLPAGLNDQEFNRLLNEVVGMLPVNEVRYLPTSVSLSQLLIAVLSGVDLIDCDLAARKAGVGVALVGPQLRNLHLDRQHFAFATSPLDKDCQCPVCQGGYTRAAIHHLLLANSLLGEQLLLQHNLFVLDQLMAAIRQAIEKGQLENFIQELVQNP